MGALRAEFDATVAFWRAFSLYALLRLGFTEDAGAFVEWLERRFRTAADRGSGRCRPTRSHISRSARRRAARAAESTI